MKEHLLMFLRLLNGMVCFKIKCKVPKALRKNQRENGNKDLSILELCMITGINEFVIIEIFANLEKKKVIVQDKFRPVTREDGCTINLSLYRLT